MKVFSTSGQKRFARTLCVGFLVPALSPVGTGDHFEPVVS